MPTPRENSIWGNIRVQFNEVQGLILNGRYREAVLLNREILKTLVRMQVDQACLVSNTLESDIDQIYESRLIDSATRECYHTIRLYADQAEAGDTPGAQAANDSFALTKKALSDYVDDQNRRGGRELPEEAEYSGGETEEHSAPEPRRGTEEPLRQTAYTGRAQADPLSGLSLPLSSRRVQGAGRKEAEPERKRAGAGRTGNVRRESARPARALRGSERRSSGTLRSERRNLGRSGRTGRSQSNRRGTRNQEQAYEIDIYSVLKVVIPLVCVILLVVLIRVLAGGGKSELKTTTTAATVQETSTAPETEPETTVPETTEAPKRWLTTDGVRVRTRPSTENSEVLTVLESGTEINYKGDYDSEWVIIDYNGQEAYVSKQYVRSEEITAPAGSSAAA